MNARTLLILSTFFLVSLNSHSENAGSLTFNLTPRAGLPIGESASYFKLEGGAGLSVGYSFPFLPKLMLIMETDYNEIRFGVVAVKKGFVTPDQIVNALHIQVSENLNSGDHRAIGAILVEQGLLTAPQLDEVLSAMGDHELNEEAVNL